MFLPFSISITFGSAFVQVCLVECSAPFKLSQFKSSKELITDWNIRSIANIGEKKLDLKFTKITAKHGAFLTSSVVMFIRDACFREMPMKT